MLSPNQKKSLALIPKVTGFLSLVGSIFILQDILKNEVKRTKSTYHRILLGLSTFDAISSIVNMLSTWPSPSDLSHSVYLASGTTATCTVQGFFNELGNITTPIYTASLTFRVLLVMLFDWRETKIRKYEIYFHLVPILTGLFMAVVGLPFQLYNNSGWLCWYAPYPAGCDPSSSTCERGELAGTFRWVHYGIVWTAILFVSVGLYLIYSKVKRIEKRSPTLHLRMSAYQREANNAAATARTAKPRKEQNVPEQRGGVLRRQQSSSGSQGSDSSFRYILDTTTRSATAPPDNDDELEADPEVDDEEAVVGEEAVVHHLSMSSAEFVAERERMFVGSGSSKFSLGDMSSEQDDLRSETFSSGPGGLNTSGAKDAANSKSKEYYRIQKINQLRRKQNRRGRRSREVALQSVLYICALYATWTFTTVSWCSWLWTTIHAFVVRLILISKI